MLRDLVRGAVIGVVEVIPGVSGGTIALIIGAYEPLITSAGHLVRALASWVRDLPSGLGRSARARAHLAQVRWGIVLPVGIGVLAAVVAAASVVAPLVEGEPVLTRALFAGLILASLVVPYRMAGRWGGREYALAAVAAVVGFLLSGIPPAAPADPPLWVVPIAAAFAVCALVLPGVSGSFLLLVLGMYAPTLAAVNERNLGYIGLFALGAVVGLGAFVPVLQWLLERRRQVTLAIMTGLMAGSLRALWPWQGERGELRPPGDEVLPVVLLVLAGIAAVVVLLVVEHRIQARAKPAVE